MTMTSTATMTTMMKTRMRKTKDNMLQRIEVGHHAESLARGWMQTLPVLAVFMRQHHDAVGAMRRQRPRRI